MSEYYSCTIYVCPERDIECGEHSGRWCVDCPKRKNADELRRIMREQNMLSAAAKIMRGDK